MKSGFVVREAKRRILAAARSVTGQSDGKTGRAAKHPDGRQKPARFYNIETGCDRKQQSAHYDAEQTRFDRTSDKIETLEK